jgi:DNA modification methylase
MTKIRLLHGDCLIELPKMPSESFHAAVCDPPYHLTSIVKRFGTTALADETSTSERSRKRADGYARLAGGFMGKAWDGGDVAFRPETWAEVLRVLKPGGHLLAFGGTRTWHRLACAIEDAGFEIRDTVAWLYGSGFPKSHDVSKAIDKAAGAERQVIRSRALTGKARVLKGGNFTGDYEGHELNSEYNETAPATPEAEAWQGWGTALKPAFEPIIVARKPLDGTVAANVLKHGCGGLNIDGCRVASAAPIQDAAGSPGFGAGRDDNYQLGTGAIFRDGGRWPANVVHDGSEEVLAAFPDAPGQLAFVGEKHGKRDSVNCYGDYGARPDTPPRIEIDKSAARFFYSAKADKADRADSKHPTVKPVDLIRWLVTLACPPGGHVLDCFAGSGTTGEACMLSGFDCTLIERDAQHARDIEHRIKRWSGMDAPLFAAT